MAFASKGWASEAHLLSLELLDVGLEGRLEGREGGFEMEGKWEGVPSMWAIGRERAWAEGREFGARSMQAERVGG